MRRVVFEAGLGYLSPSTNLLVNSLQTGSHEDSGRSLAEAIRYFDTTTPVK